jgi:transposase
MSDVEDLKSEIEQTRAELADTVDALTAKLDVKAQAAERAHELAEKATARYSDAKNSAPEPVRQAIGTVEQAARPVVAKARQDPRRAAKIAGGVILALIVLRRLRRH